MGFVSGVRSFSKNTCSEKRMLTVLVIILFSNLQFATNLVQCVGRTKLTAHFSYLKPQLIVSSHIFCNATIFVFIFCLDTSYGKFFFSGVGPPWVVDRINRLVCSVPWNVPRDFWRWFSRYEVTAKCDVVSYCPLTIHRISLQLADTGNICSWNNNHA